MAQVYLHRSQKDKLEQQKAKIEAEVASLKARPLYLDINQLTKLLKGKEVMSSKDVEKEETESDSEEDHSNPAKTMTESSKQKKWKNFSFVTEGGEQIHLIVEKTGEQNKIEESLKDE
ncbi:hypothetical protein Tco_1130833 [Tanacetum coccineum]